MSRQWFIFFLFAVLLGLTGCSDGEEAVHVDLSKRETVSVPEPQNVITYAYLPQYSHAVSFARHGKLVEYLKQATGLPLLQVFPNTFDEHVKMVERGEIDISFSNPFIYLQLARKGARAFARITERDGKPGFRGQIICRSDAPGMNSLADCRGKRWIAVDPSSAGGYLFALGLFHHNGISRDDFSEIAFAPGPGGKQEKVVLAVYAGKYDLGSIREGTLDVVGDKVDKKRLKVLASTPYYPGWVFAGRKGLSAEVTDRIAQAMFKLVETGEGREIMKNAGFTSIIPAADMEYDSVRELVRDLGLE